MLAFRPRTRPEPAAATPATGAPWAVGHAAPWTVGIEEEVMVLRPDRWTLAESVADVLASLPRSLAPSVSAGPHPGTIELRTAPHVTVADAVAELAGLRGRLTAALGAAGLKAAVAGSHPTADAGPTFAMHLHVGVPTADQATVALDRLQVRVPLLVALAANSPFLRGCETGLASARMDVGGGADARLRPDLGTIELRVLDAQTRVADVAALAALVQCLVRHEATRGRRTSPRSDPEALERDRRAAAADGLRAFLCDARGRRQPATALIADVLAECADHAAALACLDELDHVRGLAARPGEAFQRSLARLRPGEPAGGRRLRRLTGELSAAFAEVPAWRAARMETRPSPAPRAGSR